MQRGWEVEVRLQQAAARWDPSRDGRASGLTSGVWDLCCVGPHNVCGRAGEKRVSYFIAAGDIWEINGAGGLLKVFVGKNGFVAYWSYRRAWVWNVAVCISLQKLHQVICFMNKQKKQRWMPLSRDRNRLTLPRVQLLSLMEGSCPICVWTPRASPAVCLVWVIKAEKECEKDQVLGTT